ncbi:Trigger factor [Anaerohalosphaera lusitana]|uniref:Trigger factor n=1 Tax=Anaerohalosphaera lusitana TaxID=1936003 RepID=A0A1U9NQK2_9BACT|nr:trigger factor [Anaerohalosphaera lusitana]AQT70105.1 Trigger factor [Anaerohalosphaera lusitana]
MAEEKEGTQVENVVKVEDAGPCKKRIAVEIPEEKIQNALEEQYSDLRKEAVIPGFRKGRAPRRLIEKRFGSDVSQQVKVQLLAEASEEAIKDQDLNILGDPDIDPDDIELPDAGPMNFDFEVEVRPEFDLPELEGIEVEKQKVEVTEESVDEELMEMRKRAGVWEPKEDGVVEDGNQVIADVVLSVEGEEEPERKDNVEIYAREKAMVAGVSVEKLNELLAGAKEGDVKKTTVEVPKTYFSERFRGKKVDLEITVKDVKKQVPAEIDDEFLGRFGVEDEEELKERIMEAREQQAEQQQRQQMGDQIYQYLLKNTDFEMPESIVADQATRILQRQYSNMLMQGTPKEQMEQQMQELRASSEEQAKEQMKLFFIMDKIADKLDVDVSGEELNGHIAQAAMYRGRRPEKMREEMLRDGSLAQFSLQVRESKCIEQLLEKAEIKEVEGEKKAETKKTAKKKTAKKKKAAPKKSENKDEE